MGRWLLRPAAHAAWRAVLCQMCPKKIGLVMAAIGPGTPGVVGGWRTSARTYVAFAGVVCQVTGPDVGRGWRRVGLGR